MQHSKKLLQLTIIFVAIAAVVLIVCITTVRYGKAQRHRAVLQTAVAEIDSNIGRLRFSKAKELVEELIPYARNGRESLMLLQRGFRIAKESDEFPWFDVLARESHRRFPKESKILFVAAYSSMRKGDSERTLELIRHRNSSGPLDEDFTLLQAEAALRLGDRSLLPPHDEEHLLSLFEREDPAAFAQWGRREKNRPLLVDSALLYLEEGDMEEALMIAREQIDDVDHDRFYAIVAYDAGDFEQAEQRLKRYLATRGPHSDDRLLLADIQLLSGEYEEAQQNYRMVLSDQVSDLHRLALLNYAWILRQKGKRESAVALLQHGHRQFGSDVRIGLELAKAYIDGAASAVERPKAVEILKRLAAQNPEHLELVFLLFHLDAERPDPKSYLSWLWRTFNADPVDERLCRHLLWYLLGMGDASGLKLALKTYETAGGNRDRHWFLHGLGLAEALAGNYELALAALKESLALNEDLRVLYNRAVIHLKLNDLGAAEEDLWRALDLHNMSERGNRLEGAIRSRIGEIQFLKGNRRAAIRELRYALEFDPINPHALLLLEEYDEGR